MSQVYRKQSQTNSSAKRNLLQRLYLLQIRGSLREREKGQSLKLFKYFPKRLIFRLADLINEVERQAGYVYLGFTKDGQFLLSYTLHFESSGQLPVPSLYVYHLQWWQFVPFRPLKKVHEVRLFGSQEINQDLMLAVCEWPTENNKILVYGSCASSYHDGGVPCYITVTGMPPVRPCAQCASLLIASSDTDQDSDYIDSERGSSILRCLCHSFTINTKYMLVPPFPSFYPSVYMKVDRVVLLNTGDNLIALHIDLQLDSSCGSQTYTASAPNIGPASPLPISDKLDLPIQISYCACKNVEHVTQEVLGVCNCPPNAQSTYFIHVISKSVNSPDTAQSNGRAVLRWGHKPEDQVAGSEYCVLIKNRSSIADCECLVPNVIVHSKLNVASDLREDASSIVDPCLLPEAFKTWGDKHKDDFSNCESPVMLKYDFCNSEKENISPKSGKGGLKLPAKEKKVADEPIKLSDSGHSHHELHPTQATGGSSSDVSRDGADYRQAAGCVTEKTQYYAECVSNINSPSQFEDDDSIGMEYNSILSLEVNGSSSIQMKCLKQERLSQWKDPLIMVRQLTFDIEQFAHEMAQRICEEAGKKYLAFLDYDVQIIDLCELSHCAVALVLMQVQATVGKKGVAKELRSSVRKVFQTGFKFEWNIDNGTYNVIDTEELIEVNPTERISDSRPRGWNPAVHTVRQIQKEFSSRIPQSANRAVRVMTNATTFSGSSLQVLWAPAHDVAIIL